MKSRIATLLILGLGWLAATSPAQATIWVTDTVGPIPPGATYIITPGYWTKDGLVIGVTFPGGDSIPPPPNPKSDTIKLPDHPNDFAYVGDIYIDPYGNVTTISAYYWWYTGYSAPAGPIIVGDGTEPSVTVDVSLDFTSVPEDPYVILEKDTVEVYSGPMSGLVLADYDLMTVGTRGGAPGAIPTVSEWGLMVTVLLLATAGTILYGRRRPAAA